MEQIPSQEIPIQKEQTPPETPLAESLRPETPTLASQAPPPVEGRFKKIILAGLLLVVLLLAGLLAARFLPRLRLKPVTLTYWGLWEPEQVMAPVISDFEKTHPKIKIAYSRQTPKQYRERLTSSLVRGEGPDIFRFHNTWLPMLVKDLSPVPAKVASELDLAKNFYPVTSQDLKRAGQYFAVPLEIDGLGLFVNEDLFRAAGLTYPTTWEELRSTAIKLTVKDQQGRILTAGVALGEVANVEHWSDILGLMMLQNGVDLANPTDNLAEDALTYFSLFAKTPENTWDETQDNSILAFAQGRLAMIFAPSWQAHEIKVINPNLAFKIVPVPQLPGQKISWASYWVEGVALKSKYQEEAWQFLKYLVSKETLTKLYSEAAKLRLFGEPYSRVDLAQTLVNDPYVGAYISQASSARSFYLASRTFDNGINDKIIKYFEDAVNSLGKGVSPAAALETAAKGINQVLSTYGVTAPATRR